MEAIFTKEGNAVDHTPVVDVAAGTVIIQGALVGIATSPIAANALGSLATTGTFTMAKPTDEAHAVGDLLYWDDTAKQATIDDDTGANDLLGVCYVDCVLADTVTLVKIN